MSLIAKLNQQVTILVIFRMLSPFLTFFIVFNIVLFVVSVRGGKVLLLWRS